MKNTLGRKSMLIMALTAMVLSIMVLKDTWDRSLQNAESQIREKVFYDATVRLLREDYERENAEAVKRFEARLAARFKHYKEITPEFVADLTDLGSKTKMAGFMLSDLKDKVLKKDVPRDKVEDYVREKFEHHFFNEVKLNQHIHEVCRSFGEDLEANRKRFYAGVKTEWDAADFSTSAFPLEDTMQAGFREIQQEVGRLGQDVVIQSTQTVIASELAVVAGTYLTTQLSARLISQLGITVATTAATSGGAAGAGTATGGAAGTTGGPGTALIGAGVGFITGLLVDWWMTERMEENITVEIHSYFDDLHTALREGVDSEPGVVAYYRNMADAFVEKDVGLVRDIKNPGSP